MPLNEIAIPEGRTPASAGFIETFVKPLENLNLALARNEPPTMAMEDMFALRERAERGDIPPVPPSTGPTVTAIDGGEFHDGTNVVTGANMRFADAYPAAHVRILTAMGEEVSAMIGDDDSVEPGPEQFALSISVGQEMTPGAEYTFEFAMLDEDGEPVTVTQTARWTS